MAIALSPFDADTFVVGGGISGLACAAHLKRHGQTVRLFERYDYLGGVIRTLRESGYLLETGPNSLMLRQDDPLCDTLSFLGLDKLAVMAGNTGKKRFILHRGSPVALPMTLSEGLFTPLLSWKGKIRLAKELWIPQPEVPPADESVEEFMLRRFGREVLETFIDPFVKGIYASSPDRLSLDATFPKLALLEARHGSVLKGAIAMGLKARASPHPLTGKIFSFEEGMGALPAALASYLSLDAGTNSEVSGCAAIDGGFRVSVIFDEDTYYLQARQLVLAGSAARSAEILGDIAPDAVPPLTEVSYAPIAAVYMGFRRQDIAHPLDGFGLLVPGSEKRKVLGILFSSSLFPERAPAGHVLLTVFAGGMSHPKLAHAFDEDLLEIVQKEVRSILGTSGPPDFLRIQRWEEAIPQYTRGHLDRVERMRNSLPEGLHLAGSYLDGVSVSQSFSSGIRAAEAVLAHSREK